MSPRRRRGPRVFVSEMPDIVPAMRERAFVGLVDEIAARDDGVVTRGELLSRGAGLSQVHWGSVRELLTAALPGVYVHGLPVLSQRALLRVAVGYAGAAYSGLSHRCAGEHLSMLSERFGHATVSTTRLGLPTAVRTLVPMEDGRPGTIAYRRTRALDVRVVHGIPCTTVPRTLVDIAGSDGLVWLERAWKGAAYRKLLEPDAIRAELAGPGRRKGAVMMRHLVGRYPVDAIASTDYFSPKEVDVHCALLQAGFPPPEVNVPLQIGGRPFRPDFLYRSLMLVVEVDDPSHDHPVAAARDRERDALFAAAGYLVLRFTTARLATDLAGCLAEIGAAIERRLRLAA